MLGDVLYNVGAYLTDKLLAIALDDNDMPIPTADGSDFKRIDPPEGYVITEATIPAVNGYREDIPVIILGMSTAGKYEPDSGPVALDLLGKLELIVAINHTAKFPGDKGLPVAVSIYNYANKIIEILDGYQVPWEPMMGMDPIRNVWPVHYQGMSGPGQYNPNIANSVQLKLHFDFVYRLERHDLEATTNPRELDEYFVKLVRNIQKDYPIPFWELVNDSSHYHLRLPDRDVEFWYDNANVERDGVDGRLYFDGHMTIKWRPSRFTQATYWHLQEMGHSFASYIYHNPEKTGSAWQATDFKVYESAHRDVVFALKWTDVVHIDEQFVYESHLYGPALPDILGELATSVQLIYEYDNSDPSKEIVWELDHARR